MATVPRSSPAPRWWRRLGAGLLGAGLWATTAPYLAVPLGLTVDVAPIVEVVDHVVPGVVVLMVAAFALRAGRLPLGAAMVGMLAGLWMTLTHVPLLSHARHGLADWPAALFHSVPGLLVLALTAAAAARAPRTASR